MPQKVLNDCKKNADLHKLHCTGMPEDNENVLFPSVSLLSPQAREKILLKFLGSILKIFPLISGYFIRYLQVLVKLWGTIFLTFFLIVFVSFYPNLIVSPVTIFSSLMEKTSESLAPEKRRKRKVRKYFPRFVFLPFSHFIVIKLSDHCKVIQFFLLKYWISVL